MKKEDNVMKGTIEVKVEVEKEKKIVKKADPAGQPPISMKFLASL